MLLRVPSVMSTPTMVRLLSVCLGQRRCALTAKLLIGLYVEVAAESSYLKCCVGVVSGLPRDPQGHQTELSAFVPHTHTCKVCCRASSLDEGHPSCDKVARSTIACVFCGRRLLSVRACSPCDACVLSNFIRFHFPDSLLRIIVFLLVCVFFVLLFCLFFSSFFPPKVVLFDNSIQPVMQTHHCLAGERRAQHRQGRPVRTHTQCVLRFFPAKG